MSIALTGRQARLPLLVASAGAAFALWRLASWDFVNPNEMFHPHGYCYLWLPDLVAAHVVSDSVIALSYLTISLTLVYLVRKARRHIPFSWMFLAFGTFIVACGMTHAMEIVTLWQPWFWLSADVKMVTALASVSTAIALPPLVPKILAMVAAANVSEQRRLALEEANAELERRVDERTKQLSEAMEREHALREHAEEANRLKDEFLSTVSHELRTPLTAILGWGEMLAKHQLAPAAQTRAIASIRRNARAQTQLVDDLLDVSRMTIGKLRLNRRAVAFDEIVEGAVDSIGPVAAAKGISVVVHAPRSSSFVLGDSHRLQQIVWNLLSNAVKFTPDGGTVTISMTRGPRQVRLEVADTGIGLDPPFMSHIFERFRQADSSPSRQQMGLGLGLALSRYLTELHGGCIRAHSDGLGRGATFTLEFPLTHPPAQSSRLPLGDETPRLDGARILVVDDDADGVDMVTAALTEVGAEVVPSFSASEAIERVRGGGIDLIVSDLAMPQEDGYAFIRTVRDELASRIPAIALTARVRQEDRSKALSSGFQLHVAKPVLPIDLVTAVAHLLQQHAL